MPQSVGSGASGLLLPEDEVHVWYADVDAPTRDPACWTALLSVDERARAERFHRECDRSRFGATRGVLRSLLAAYCAVPPSEIAFAYAAAGKPLLAAPAGVDLQFNVSHSHALAVFAFVRHRRVGVDVEHVRPMGGADRIVRRYFAPEEIAAYEALPEEARRQGFFNGWTRKEAFVKAVGQGLGYPLASFAVSLAPGEPARFLRFDNEPETRAPWALWDVALEASYVAALAVEGSGLRVRTQRWPE